MKEILLISLIALIGCEPDVLFKEPDNAELEQLKGDLKEAQENLSDAEASLNSCRLQVHDACTKLDKVSHTHQPQFVEVGSDYVTSPCSDSLKVRIYKDDPENGWVYLRYEEGGKTFFSDRLVYSGEKSHRNSIRVDSTLISAETCDSDTGTCSISCQPLMTTHAPTCK